LWERCFSCVTATNTNQSKSFKPAEAAHNRGVYYAEKGDYDRAIREFTEAIRLKPDYAEAHFDRGGIHCDNRDYTEAIQLKPNFTEAYFNRGIAYDDNGDYDKAIADCAETIWLKPDFAGAYNRGLAYYAKGDYARARADWEKTLQINPYHTQARNNLEIMEGMGY
jgi:tetratricopeptide (TPR) repeat protein